MSPNLVYRHSMDADKKGHTMERFVEGLRIEETGEGQPILFVHADFVDGGMWNQVMAKLSSRFRVACFDKRGYGRSEPAHVPICRRRELETVVRALGLGAVHLVGCSNGGQSSLDLALERPELVRSLTLVNALPSGFVFEGAMPPELLDMMSAAARGDTAAASELQIRIWFDGPARVPSSLGGAKLEARAEASRMNRLFVERGTFAIADAVPKDPLTPPAARRLGEIHVPTLVVSGALDYAENRRASKLLADGIPGARLTVMDDCAHVPPLEAAESFSAMLASFIEEIAADPHRLS
jgi:pimeloyl-ACP methyl ester carboxylesterase